MGRGWVGPRAGQGDLEERKMLHSFRESKYKLVPRRRGRACKCTEMLRKQKHWDGTARVHLLNFGEWRVVTRVHKVLCPCNRWKILENFKICCRVTYAVEETPFSKRRISPWYLVIWSLSSVRCWTLRVVESWIWISLLTRRSDMFCAVLHSESYQISEQFAVSDLILNRYCPVTWYVVLKNRNKPLWSRVDFQKWVVAYWMCVTVRVIVVHSLVSGQWRT
jgi:hypothetical protein